MKTRARGAHKQALDHRGERAVRAEVLYLEVARGRRGVPALYGGWIDQERVYYVVQRVSASLVRRGTRGAPSGRPSPLWLKRCQDAPVEAARALLECFRSFTDAGYHMEELHGSHLTLNDAGEVFAIDAPVAPRRARRRGLDWALRRPKTPPDPRPRAPGSNRSGTTTACGRPTWSGARSMTVFAASKRARERRGAGAAGRRASGWTRARTSSTWRRGRGRCH